MARQRLFSSDLRRSEWSQLLSSSALKPLSTFVLCNATAPNNREYTLYAWKYSCARATHEGLFILGQELSKLGLIIVYYHVPNQKDEAVEKKKDLFLWRCQRQEERKSALCILWCVDVLQRKLTGSRCFYFLMALKDPCIFQMLAVGNTICLGSLWSKCVQRPLLCNIL